MNATLWDLHAQGATDAMIAVVLGVRTRTVQRALSERVDPPEPTPARRSSARQHREQRVRDLWFAGRSVLDIADEMDWTLTRARQVLERLHLPGWTTDHRPDTRGHDPQDSA